MSIKKTHLEQFRVDNNLQKKEIAEYLGISTAFISRVCRGECGLPDKQLKKLMSNQKGWNTAALTQEPEEEKPEILANELGLDLLNRISETLSELAQSREEYIKLLKTKDAQIDRLTRILDNWTSTQSARS